MDSGDPIVNIVGEKVALGPRRRDLLPLYLKWMNDFEVTRSLGAPTRPLTWEAEEAWYQRNSTDQSGESVGFTVYERTGMRPIGTTSLNRIDPANRTAEFGIVIGEKDCWGKGYGTEATRLMLDYGFTVLGLHHIMLRVYAFNVRAIRAYARAGFQIAGRLREAYRFGGRAHDVVLMDCLATEFQSPVLYRLLPK